MSWIIFNASMKQWGQEIFPTKEAAEQELRIFFRGHRVDFRKFTIQEQPEKS